VVGRPCDQGEGQLTGGITIATILMHVLENIGVRN